MTHLLPGILGAALLAASTPPRRSPPAYAAEVSAVVVPMRVTGAAGEPLRGLTAGDFRLEVDGDAQPIASVVEVDLEPDATSSPGVQPPPEARRCFLFLFDLAFTRSSALMRAREAVLRFAADGLRPDDLAAVATYSAAGGMRLLAPFSTDREQLVLTVETMGLTGSAEVLQDPLGFLIRRPGASAAREGRPTRLALDDEILSELGIFAARLAAREEESYRGAIVEFVHHLAALAGPLDAIAGGKTVLFFSQGFDGKFLVGQPVSDFANDAQRMLRGDFLQMPSHDRFGTADVRGILLRALDALAAASATFYTVDVDVGGSGDNLGPEPAATVTGGEDALFILADRTSGVFYRDAGNVTRVLEDVERQNRHGYVLSFEPAMATARPTTHRIQVEVDRRGARVAHRRAYRDQPSHQDRDPIERRMAAADVVARDLVRQSFAAEISATPFPGPAGLARIPVVVELRPPDPEPGGARGRREIEIFGYAVDAEGRFRDAFHERVALESHPPGSTQAIAGLKFVDLLLAPAGEYTVKVLLQDPATGAQTAIARPVTVPDFNRAGLQMIGPILLDPSRDWLLVRGDATDAASSAQRGVEVDYPFVVTGTEYVPGVRPSIPPGQPQQFELEVAHLELDPATLEPQTTIEIACVGSDGAARPVTEAALLRPPAPGPDGSYELFFQYGLASDLAHGDYELRVTLTDRLAGETLVRAAPFRVAADR